jgi:hypothetical protein
MVMPLGHRTNSFKLVQGMYGSPLAVVDDGFATCVCAYACVNISKCCFSRGQARQSINHTRTSDWSFMEPLEVAARYQV